MAFIVLPETPQNTEEQRNAISLLTNMEEEKFNSLKKIMYLEFPNIVGPTTQAKFTSMCQARNILLSNTGIVDFKNRFKARFGFNTPITAQVGPKTAQAVLYVMFEERLSDPGQDTPWMEIAKGEIGVREFEGAGDNPRIVEYLRTTNLGRPYSDNDETAWCSAFVNFCMQKVDLPRTKNALAKSWLTYGKFLTAPQYGCIVVLNRPPNPSEGHVGFFMGERNGEYLLLSGNSEDRVGIDSYSKSRLATNGLRFPT